MNKTSNSCNSIVPTVEYIFDDVVGEGDGICKSYADLVEYIDRASIMGKIGRGIRLNSRIAVDQYYLNGKSYHQFFYPNTKECYSKVAITTTIPVSVVRPDVFAYLLDEDYAFDGQNFYFGLKVIEKYAPWLEDWDTHTVPEFLHKNEGIHLVMQKRADNKIERVTVYCRTQRDPLTNEVILYEKPILEDK